jgi:hypothetical protein
LVETLKIFRPQQRPDEIQQKASGNRAAQNQIKHVSNLLAGRNVGNQQREHDDAVDNGDKVTHKTPAFQWCLSAPAHIRPRDGRMR